MAPTQEKIVVERAKPEDAEAILKLKQAAWLQTYPNEQLGITVADIRKKLTDEDIVKAVPAWQKAIAQENDTSDKVTFVAKRSGKVIGFTQPCTEDGKRMLGAMYVTPEAQGMGAGGKLIRQAIKWLGPQSDIFINVVRYNQNAIGFYEHFGFKRTGKEMPEEVDQNGLKLLPEIEMEMHAKSSN